MSPQFSPHDSKGQDLLRVHVGSDSRCAVFAQPTRCLALPSPVALFNMGERPARPNPGRENHLFGAWVLQHAHLSFASWRGCPPLDTSNAAFSAWLRGTGAFYVLLQRHAAGLHGARRSSGDPRPIPGRRSIGFGYDRLLIKGGSQCVC